MSWHVEADADGQWLVLGEGVAGMRVPFGPGWILGAGRTAQFVPAGRWVRFKVLEGPRELLLKDTLSGARFTWDTWAVHATEIRQHRNSLTFVPL